MNWFAGLTQVAEIKKRYRTLAMQHHPDRGGSTDTMQQINAAYHAALIGCHEKVSTDEQGEQHTYYYNEAREQSVMDKIDEILKAGVIGENVELWLVGVWLWVLGNTRPIKDVLKALGLRWHSKRQCWYWRPAGRRSAYNRNATFADLASAYGAERIAARQDADGRPHQQRQPKLAPA